MPRHELPLAPVSRPLLARAIAGTPDLMGASGSDCRTCKHADGVGTNPQPKSTGDPRQSRCDRPPMPRYVSGGGCGHGA